MNDFPSILLKLEGYFAPNGILATKYHLKRRESQQKMLATICTALAQDKGALVEASTGTGKTFAYLLPAAEFITNLQGQGKSPRVVISTASKNLQDQLSHKDFPVIRSLYPNIRTFTWKGANNYLCLNRLERVANRRQRTPLVEEAEQLWARQADLIELDLGTRDEMPVEVSDATWQEICGCTPACCKPEDEHVCYKRRAFHQARESHILCVNHSLMAFLGLFAGILHPARPDPGETLLILDEGHELLNQVKGALNKDFSLESLGRLIRQLPSEERWNLKCKLETVTLSLGLLVADDEPVHITPEREELIHVLTELGHLMLQVGQEYQKEFERQSAQGFYEDEKDKLDAVAHYSSLLAHANQLLTHLKTFPPDSMLELSKARKQKKLTRISFYPFTYATELQRLYSFSAVPPIITSATLINGTKEQVLHRYCLRPEQVIISKIEADYNYDTTVRGYFFPQIPAAQINDPATLGHWLKAILPYSHGNALVLFTNYKVLDEVFANLRPWGEERGYTMLSQSGEATVQEMVATMKEKHNTVLFGNAALWTGVDIRGVNLSSLIVTKMPFQSMDNFTTAYSAYLESQNLDPFRTWMLPEMINRLRQGIGRLKRDEDDRGLIWILDPRFTTASYKQDLMGKLPLLRWKKILTEQDLPPLADTQTWLGVRAPAALPVTPAGGDIAEDEPF